MHVEHYTTLSGFTIHFQVSSHLLCNPMRSASVTDVLVILMQKLTFLINTCNGPCKEDFAPSIEKLRIHTGVVELHVQTKFKSGEDNSQKLISSFIYVCRVKSLGIYVQDHLHVSWRIYIFCSPVSFSSIQLYLQQSGIAMQTSENHSKSHHQKLCPLQKFFPRISLADWTIHSHSLKYAKKYSNLSQKVLFPCFTAISLLKALEIACKQNYKFYETKVAKSCYLAA